MDKVYPASQADNRLLSELLQLNLEWDLSSVTGTFTKLSAPLYVEQPRLHSKGSGKFIQGRNYMRWVAFGCQQFKKKV